MGGLGGAPMAETLIKICGLCVTYMAFQTATEACREPVARAVEKIEREGLLQFLVEFVTMLEEAGCRAIGERSAATKPRRQAHSRTQKWGQAAQETLHRMKQHVNIPVTDLCDMCLENFRTVEELRNVAVKMGLPYPGDEMEPCSFCRERAISLYELEAVYMNPMGRD